jgi:nucleotide-binding universal stress UspA family protein
MKTILVPTDFSKASRNAINYAVEIAKLTKSKLVLFHVYTIPVVSLEVSVMLPVHEMEKETMNNLRRIKKNIHLKHGNKLLIECKCVWGFPVEEINLFAEKNKIDLIVMGMEGTGYLTEKVIGSITTSLIKKAKCPVLAVSKHVKFRSIKRMVLACDYTEMNNESVFDPLKEIASLFKSHVYVLNVVRELETLPSISKAVEGIRLNRTLESVDHSFHYTKSEDVVEGINDFVSEKKIDMVVMIPRVHTILQGLFHGSNTKRTAFHNQTPLLALHE